MLFVEYLRNPENVFVGRSKKCGDREMLGLVVLKLMVGSLIGIGVLAWRLLAVAGILLKTAFLELYGS